MSGDESTFRRWLGELKRRKVFRVAVAYLVIAWLAVQVAGATFEPLGLPAWALRLVIVLAALGFPLACALAWAFDVTPRGIERTEAAAPSVPGQVAPGPPALPADSVAILPFADLSPERDQEYFCDGIAEEIINSLCCVRGLRVASRTSSFQFKGRAADVREIGRALGVVSVLEGSVRKSGDRVRITAQLVSCADGYHLWSESFDRRLADVFATQTEIAQKLTRALSLTLSRQELALIERGGTRSAEAYDLYLRGQAYLREGGDSAMAPAIRCFREAIAHDASFAQAHAGLANVLAVKGLWRIGMTQADFDEAYAASRKALELEPRMPEAYVARACLLSMQGRVTEADQAFEEAIRLNPASYDAHYLYARHCVGNGAFERAVPLFEEAIRLRPDDYQAPCLLAGALVKLGRMDEHHDVSRRAMTALERQLVLDPLDIRAMQLGTVQAARLGDRRRARELAERVVAMSPESFATFYNVACAHAVMGDRDEALAALDRAVSNGRGNLEWMEHDPDFDGLRDDPRFQSIVGRLRDAGTVPTA